MAGPEPRSPARILIIGDSISIGYTPHVAALLAGEAIVEHNPGNAMDSGTILANLEEWTAGPWDVIHLNCGLHDIKRPKHGPTVFNSTDVYERNLREIFGRLTARPATRLIWAVTTPVIDERHARRPDIDRFQRDVVACNAVAGRVLKEFTISVTDLDALVVARGVERLIGDDGVHFTDEGYRILGEAVVAGIFPG